ncbi:hypothetical protein [Streptomyces alboflavus]|uniref:hypothetical protein n=1 Tax=Streptomyces alboflavus TaxID=67267 RepID=UPI000A41F4F8|nr:hypothetical protein [Streptomyces alboflavus]
MGQALPQAKAKEQALPQAQGQPLPQAQPQEQAKAHGQCLTAPPHPTVSPKFPTGHPPAQG